MAHDEDRWKRGGRHGTGRRWRVRYADPDGRERSKSFDRKVDADRFRAQAEADVQRGTWIDPAAGKITLRRYMADWLKAQTFDEATRENTERRLRLHVYPVLGDRTLGQLAASPSSVQAWVRGTSLSPATARGVFAVLSMVMSAAVDDSLIQRNPCQVRSVRPPRADKRKVVPWQAAAVDPVRAGLLRLSAHVAEFPAIAVALPWRTPEAEPVTVRLLFTNTRGAAIRSRVFDSAQWHPALRTAGLAESRENGFHALRHHFASVLLHDGVDIAALATYLGHHDPGFTLRTYVHLMPDAADRMRSVVDRALSLEPDGPGTAQQATE
jgi:integrase